MRWGLGGFGGGRCLEKGKGRRGKMGKGGGEGEEVPSCFLYVYIAKRTQLAIFDPSLSLSLSLRLSLHSNIVSGRKKKHKKKTIDRKHTSAHHHFLLLVYLQRRRRYCCCCFHAEVVQGALFESIMGG